MKIEAINDGNTDFALVKIKGDYPYCDKHGAMNKVSVTEHGGYWRCLQGQCRAGCNEIEEKAKDEWQLNIWRSGRKWTLLFHLERWNAGDEWRLYFLFWEFNLRKIYTEENE